MGKKTNSENIFFERRRVFMSVSGTGPSNLSFSALTEVDEGIAEMNVETATMPIHDLGDSYQLSTDGVKIGPFYCEWPERISGALNYLNDTNYSALLAVCRETFEGVLRVMGENIFDRIDDAGEALVDVSDQRKSEMAEIWLNDTVSMMQRLCCEKIWDELRRLALNENGDVALKQEVVELMNSNFSLRDEVTESIREKEEIGRELCEEMERSQRAQKEYIKREQRGEPDQLTGCDTKVALYFDMHKEMSEILATQEGTMFVVALDLDRFKSVNDTGRMEHLGGDIVLKTFVKIVQKYLDNKGKIYRYGGEEFVMLLTGVGEDQIENFMEGLHEMVFEELKWEQDPEKLKIGYRLTHTLKDLWEGGQKAFGKAMNWTFPALFRKQKESGYLPLQQNQQKLVPYSDRGIPFGSSASFEALPSMRDDNKYLERRVTFCAGVVQYPARDERSMPFWDRVAVYMKYRDILRSLDRSMNFDWEELVGNDPVARQRFESSIPRHGLNEDLAGTMAYLLLAADRGSYTAKLAGRNGSVMLDGTSENVRDGHRIARCQVAGDQ